MNKRNELIAELADEIFVAIRASRWQHQAPRDEVFEERKEGMNV